MVDAKGLHLNQHTADDKPINAGFQLQHDNETRDVKVKKRALNPDGQTTGSYDKNSILN